VSYRGVATGAGIEPACSCSRDRAGCQQPTRYQCGRRDSNAQAARFELARYASSLHSRIGRREGIEPPRRTCARGSTGARSDSGCP